MTSNVTISAHLSDLSAKRFWKDGYIVCPGLAEHDICDRLHDVSAEHLRLNMGPIEYEVDVQYPGSPADQDSEGAMTPRRLLHTFSRDSIFREWATSSTIREVLSALFASQQISLSQSHHNCVMTKSSGYSSATLWHQDNRYWSFDEPDLISVWLALGTENKTNGCLRVIPGSHLLHLERGRLDAALFLRPDLKENKELIRQSRLVELNKGDVLFFHSRVFHAAGRNLTNRTKYSSVFTYHRSANQPIANTRSSRYESVSL